MKMVVAHVVLHVGPKSIGVKLGCDLVTVKIVAFYSHNFHTHQSSELWHNRIKCWQVETF